MSSLKGDLAEMDFKLKAMQKGLIVSSPENSQTIYDILVDNKKQIFRIQVKSNFQDGTSYGMNLGCGTKGKRLYTDDEIHFFACYIKQLESWYIIPSECTSSMKITFYPNGENSKWNKYREAWDLLV